jgi:hypothetical protein
LLFVDKINLYSLLRIVLIGGRYGAVYYFEPMSTKAQRALSFFVGLKLIRIELHLIEYQMSHVTEKTGESVYPRIYEEVRALRAKIREDLLVNNPLIAAMARVWDPTKLVQYFDRQVDVQVEIECLRMELMEWMLRVRLKGVARDSCLLIERSLWFAHTCDYARSRQIDLKSYRVRFATVAAVVSKGCRLVGRLVVKLAALSVALVQRFARSLLSKRPNETNGTSRVVGPGVARPNEAGVIAINYVWSSISSSPADRESNMSLVEEMGIPLSQALFYGFKADTLLDRETLDFMREKGFRLLGDGPGIESWRPTRRRALIGAGIAARLLWGFATCWMRWRWCPLYYFLQMVKLSWAYAYWYDFYAANRVIADISVLSRFGTEQLLALDKVGAASFTFQYSFGLVPEMRAYSSSYGEDVQFIFSPDFERDDPPVGRFVHIGYTYDYIIPKVRYLDRSVEIRRNLENAGARFVLCFFDEGSADLWNSFTADANSAEEYRFLLNWLLEDPTLGIILKPKRPSILSKRLRAIEDLIDRAKNTGRCYFMMNEGETLRSNYYPSEAAMAADVCIGRLSGVTAALEARLAGARALLANSPKCGMSYGSMHPFYDWGLSHVVFKEWDTLRDTVNFYRQEPQTQPNFGNWDAGISHLDPFQDGRAGERMGTYIMDVISELARDRPKREALAIADLNYAQCWGEQYITEVKGEKNR